jgi:molybdenum cofactor cytidylyltransferase
MGQAKAWLKYRNEFLLQRLVRLACHAGADPVVVVVGAVGNEASCLEGHLVTAQQVKERLLADWPELLITVGVPQRFPIDSIRAGLRGLKNRAGHDNGPPSLPVLLWPIDYPFAELALIQALEAALAFAPEKIAVPEVQGRRGHPILLGARVVQELESRMADGGARFVVRRDPQRIIPVPATDGRLFAALNTPEQALALGLDWSVIEDEE